MDTALLKKIQTLEKDVDRLSSWENVTSAGTSFPASPVTYRRFFRTDLLLDFVYDGTRWVTINEYNMTLPIVPGTTRPITASDESTVAAGPIATSGASVYLTKASIFWYVATTHNVSNYWTAQFKQYYTGGFASTFGPVLNSYQAGRVANDYYLDELTLNTVIAVANLSQIAVAYTKVGAPGGLYEDAANLRFRIVGT